MNLGKISARFLRGDAVAENLARDESNIHDPQANHSIKNSLNYPQHKSKTGPLAH
jgi:hypothetical protein